MLSPRDSFRAAARTPGGSLNKHPARWEHLQSARLWKPGTLGRRAERVSCPSLSLSLSRVLPLAGWCTPGESSALVSRRSVLPVPTLWHLPSFLKCQGCSRLAVAVPQIREGARA